LTALQPKNVDALGDLAAQYTTLASTYYTNYQNALTESTAAAPASQVQLSTTTPFGKAFGSAKSTDPIDTAVLAQQSEQVQTVAATLTNEENLIVSTYQSLAKLQPNNATTQLQLGQAAEGAGNSAVAIAAYKKFLQLAPTDPQAPTIKKELKTLQASSGG
jgi:regulator of sirC expression with transglutaminase-like and TPR domain